MKIIGNGASQLMELSEEQQEEIKKFITEEMKKFNDVKGSTPLVKHEIKLIDDTPLKQRYRPRNPAMQKIINEEVDAMLAENIIRPSNSPWSSPVVIAKKKDGRHRFCVDFRCLNKVSRKDAYPLPQIQAILDKLQGERVLSTIDLKNGYWQIELTEKSKPLTAFTVPERGLFEFNVMPFGLHTAPATFQRLLDSIITPDMAPHAFASLGDIIIVTKTYEQHIEVLRTVFQKLRDAKLKPNPEKCEFGRTQLKYLGHVVNEKGLHTDPEKVTAIKSIPPPKNQKELKRFFGMLSWYRRFVKDLSKVAAPLSILLKKKTEWTWNAEQDRAFEALKSSLTQAPVLACPNWNLPFILQTDASLLGLGAVLTQIEGDNEYVIAYASRTLNAAEKNYSVTELECLAVRWGIWKMRQYLEGYPFTVVTDHQSLKWLEKLENPSGRLARWALELSQWDFDVQYRKGADNNVADILSRNPMEVNSITASKDKWHGRMLKAVTADPINFPDYRVEKGRLFRHILHSLDFNDVDPNDEWKLCVDENEKSRILEENHDNPTAGHLGVAKTLAKLARNYYWPGMFREATRYVRACKNCQKHKAQQVAPAGKMHATNVEQPWEMVSVDLVGPLPRSNNGNSTLLVMQDRLTKWIEVKPLRKATGVAIAQAIKEQIILKFGCPRVIISDNGRQFISKEFRQVLADAKIEHRKTPPYSPQCNPVERVNRTLKTMIKQYIDTSQKTWDKYLGETTFAYNTAIHDSTGYSPAYLNFGRELMVPGSLNQEVQRRTRSSLNDRIKRMNEALELAKIEMARAFQRQQRNFNLRRRDWQPSIGESVLKKQNVLSSKIDDRNAKLCEKFIGPFVVVKKISPVIFNLQSEDGIITERIHVKDLKPFIENMEE